jgi:hypothetical protein
MWIKREELEAADPDLRAEIVLKWLEQIARLFKDFDSAAKAVEIVYQNKFFETAFFYLFDKTIGNTSVKGIQESDGSRRPFNDVIDVFLAHYILCGEKSCDKRMGDWIKMLSKQTEKGLELWQKI